MNNKTQFLEIPGGRIAYDDTGGSSPLVVAAPGMGDTRGVYRHLSPFLEIAGLRVVTFDLSLDRQLQDRLLGRHRRDRQSQ
jgi:alpha-beta hydrolase superfamily lysophospholipase